MSDGLLPDIFRGSFSGSVPDGKPIEVLVCYGVELHDFLPVRRGFSKWMREQISQHSLVQGKDYEYFKTIRFLGSSYVDVQDCALSVDAAIQIAQSVDGMYGDVFASHVKELRKGSLPEEGNLREYPKVTVAQLGLLTRLIRKFDRLDPFVFMSPDVYILNELGINDLTEMTPEQMDDAISFVRGLIEEEQARNREEREEREARAARAARARQRKALKKKKRDLENQTTQPTQPTQ